MRDPVDVEENESAIGRSIVTESINAERASLGEIPIDDESVESIRSDNTWESAVEASETTSGNC